MLHGRKLFKDPTIKAWLPTNSHISPPPSPNTIQKSATTRPRPSTTDKAATSASLPPPRIPTPDGNNTVNLLPTPSFNHPRTEPNAPYQRHKQQPRCRTARKRSATVGFSFIGVMHLWSLRQEWLAGRMEEGFFFLFSFPLVFDDDRSNLLLLSMCVSFDFLFGLGEKGCCLFIWYLLRYFFRSSFRYAVSSQSMCMANTLRDGDLHIRLLCLRFGRRESDKARS